MTLNEKMCVQHVPWCSRDPKLEEADAGSFSFSSQTRAGPEFRPELTRSAWEPGRSFPTGCRTWDQKVTSKEKKDSKPS